MISDSAKTVFIPFFSRIIEEVLDIPPAVEFAVWLSISAFSALGAFASALSYRRTGSRVFIFLILSLLSEVLFGIGYFVGRLTWDVNWIRFGVIMCILGFVFIVKFFRMVYYPIRKYEWLQVLVGIGWAAVIIDVMLEPPVLTEYAIEYNTVESIGVMTCLMSVIIISLDYGIFSIRKVRREGYSSKMLIFVAVMFGGMIATIIIYSLRLLGIMPFYSVFIPSTLFIGIEAIVLLYYPAITFLAPITPRAFLIINSSGIPIYEQRLGRIEKTLLLSGAIAALNSVFKEALTEEARVKRIIFHNHVVYAQFMENIFLIFIDRNYSPIIERSLANLAGEIKKIENDTGDISEDGIDSAGKERMGEIFRTAFFYLPQFVT